MTPSETSDAPKKGAYGDILRATSVIGLSQLLSIVFAVIRTKALALLLGPSGVGLFGIYNAIIDMAASVAGFGVSSSGVRQVAESDISGDTARLARTVTALGWVSLALAIAGGLGLAALAWPVSQLSFGDATQVWPIVLLGIALFLRLVAAAPLALLQGRRRIADLARATIIGAALNTAVTIPLVWWLGPAGVLPSMLAAGVVTLLAALWFCRGLGLPPLRLSLLELRSETAALLRLGLAFMVTGLLATGATFAIRILVVQGYGLDAAGLYQAAWTIGGLYAGFILQAMGTDFYPRLTGVSDDHQAVNRMVNEQTEISLLLAGPGLLATLTFAPLVMTILYSHAFDGAATLLRWLCLGMLLRIIAWPMGFVVLAKNKQLIFFWTEVAATVVHVGLAALLLPVLGLDGAGIAFVGLYVWHGLLIYFIVRRMTGFAMSPVNLRLGVVFLVAAAIVQGAVIGLPVWPAMAVGTLATMAAGLYALKLLLQVMPQLNPFRRRALA